uniref:DUF4218 domain-containing protein n=1 Tax=Chenopodium quinoa TaxID=63459 RepID=A0A803MTE6_CHEQI
MPDLQPIELPDGGEEIPRSSFWMTLPQKRLFCQTIKNAKLPQGYASNIGRCVQVNEGKITGYKSHDAHFCMHYLLPIALKVTLPKDVATPLIRLCRFFKGIWNKTINPCDLDNLHSKIVETLCQLERIFPPTFFTVMVHLPVHLVEEIRLGGPVCSRCMYANTPSKGVNHSNSQPFLPSVGKPTRRKGKATKKSQYGFMIDHNTLAQAHTFVIFNCNSKDVERYIKVQWFKQKVALEEVVISDHVKWLSQGPSYVAKRYTGYFVNVYHFHTMKRDANSSCQNHGVTLTALTPSFASSKDQNPILGDVAYYGSIEDIIEISYHGHFSVVLFKCVWFYSELDDDFTLVNKNKTICGGEPFILASQARQVFLCRRSN